MVKAVVWFVLGGLSAACLGGPIIGAISGLFWPHIGGGHTESAAVARIDAAIYGRSHTEGDYFFGDKNFGDSECMLRMRQRDFDIKDGHINEVFLNLSSAIRRHQGWTKTIIGDQIAREAVEKLPYPILGALEGCIAHSLLAPLCEANVQRIKHTARLNASAIIAREEAKNDADWEKVWCTADRAFSAHP